MRLFFLLYLVLPQTQGARIIYQTHLHPWLEENETQIEDFIASAHKRLRAAGIAYLKRAIELLRTNVLGLPPGEPEPPVVPEAAPPQSYTQALLARFSLPSARWSGNAGTGGADFYNLLAGAVSAMTAPTAAATPAKDTLIPPTVGEADRANFVATQRERLRTLLSALDREAARLDSTATKARADSVSLDREGVRFGNPWAGGDGAGGAERPPSGASGMSKSRSEADFEKIDAESGAEELDHGVRRRATPAASGGGSWMPWGWGGGGGGGGGEGKSTGVDSE